MLLRIFCVFFVFSNLSYANENEHNINELLNAFHQAAAKAEMKSYFSLMSQEAVFIGTDPSERWTKNEFKSFVEPIFSQGIGWLYIPQERNISLINNEQVAFFDELLINEAYGLCRGVGVVIKTTDGWKISQYNLSIPLPNEIANDLIKQIKSFKDKK
jgi:ketosteroid isomerase-like protein